VCKSKSAISKNSLSVKDTKKEQLKVNKSLNLTNYSKLYECMQLFSFMYQSRLYESKWISNLATDSNVLLKFK